MRTAAIPQPNYNVSQQPQLRTAAAPRAPLPLVSHAIAPAPLLQRQPACACGGGCPHCQEAAGLHSHLTIGAPDDQYEQEADRIAEQVLRMPESAIQRQVDPAEPIGSPTVPQVMNEIDAPKYLIQRMFAIGPEDDPTQRTIGNQAVQRIMQAHAEELNAGLAGTSSPRFGHDFSRIPVPPPTGGAIQTKLAINTPGDEYEQEADRVAEQVMRMPEPQLQRACPCGGGCPRCQTQQVERGKEPRKTRRIRDSEAAVSMVPPVVDDVLRSPGQPLDAPTRTFMEPRLGHDFSRVRVHSDAQAAAAAQAVQARAFTIGRDVVFGADEYRPGTTKGKQLLAHELAHVVQQAQSRPVVQRQDEGNDNQPQAITFRLIITPQISWAITALSVRPVAEEDTWACLAGVPEYDKPRILLNYLIQYRGNSAFAQIDAQRPADLDRDTYLMGVAKYIWSLIRDNFMTTATQRMSRNAGFRRKVDEAARGRGCGRVPYIEPGSETAVV